MRNCSQPFTRARQQHCSRKEAVCRSAQKMQISARVLQPDRSDAPRRCDGRYLPLAVPLRLRRLARPVRALGRLANWARAERRALLYGDSRTGDLKAPLADRAENLQKALF